MPQPLITVLSAHRHPRLRYTLKELGRDLGYQFQLMTDREKWTASSADAKVVYGEAKKGETAWPAHPVLQGADAGAKDLTVDSKEGTPRFFASGEGHDLLACIFFALSRYEEYKAFTPDHHGRFPASESHAQQHGYLERPVVREWATLLADSLRRDFPTLPPPKRRPFTFQPTYDIDILWAWQHRGLRGIGAGIKDFFSGRFGRAWRRFTAPKEQDPFQTLAYIQSLHPRTRPQIFWLLSNGQDRRDTNPYPIPPAQEALIQELAEQSTIGIHPSYHSSDRPELIREEIARLKGIIGRNPLHSRQHFLRFRIPQTYRELQRSAITNDHSMGYADAVGWRAGTNLPFHWYDLERESMTGLLVHPFAAMDGTLKDYLQLSVPEALRKVETLAEDVRPFGGVFPLLWHNSSFSDDYGWAGWREMYEDCIKFLGDEPTVSG
ncbi:polysaccharide deacetylase family protein [Neolewinella agarilytica]|uniref:polysaccharide deacetylase family protein n=1 Tax=Neolewinella agarilytica TaxID=478744 RepID=UPI002353C281|nr:polysaccharide deacetylase family protein [Neolewinella agarilytica]